MSKNYKKIKKYYNMGFYSKENVRKCVEKGQITAAEYEDITGEQY